MLNSAIVRRLMPHAPQSLVEGIAATAPAVFTKYGLDDVTSVAHAMAQFCHETGGGTIREENGNYRVQGLIDTWPRHFNKVNAPRYAHNPRKLFNYIYEPPLHDDLGNRPGTEDGWNFRGRSGSQITGRNGYTAVAEKTGLDCVNNPDVVNDPLHWLEASVADFVICGCLPYAKRDDVRGVSAMLNCGHIVPTSKIVGYASRQAWLARWKRGLADAAKAAPAPEDSLTREEIEELQNRLRDLGYPNVGLPDGKWGSNTTGAIAAFQRHEMLPVTGHYDEATKAAIEDTIARPVSPERAEATADDLRDAGSQTIAAADTATLVGRVKAGAGALIVGGGAGSQMGLLDTAQDAVDKAETAKSMFGRVHDLVAPFLADERVIAIGLFLIIGGLIVTYAARKVIRRRVDDHRTGIHAGT